MVVLENRKQFNKGQEQKQYAQALSQEKLNSIVQTKDDSCDPMVHRKLEVCNDVERNPGPKPGGNAAPVPINDNPRVSKIGILNTYI